MPARKQQVNGPDWADIAIFLRELGNLHGVIVTITFAPGVFDGPSIVASISSLRVPAEGNIMGEPVLVIGAEYPCKDHKTLEACVFHGLYEMDYLLSRKVWEQLSLPFTAA